tara:strand:+ start:3414 stop:5033 length:1620 start_codon:yes stop_codon:yes gene_type:complete
MKNLINKSEIMKYFKYLIFTLPVLFIIGCDLDEEPPFLDETIYTDAQSAQAARDGIYQSLTTYNTQERRLFITNLYSGLMFTGKGGNRVNTRDMSTLVSLKPGYHMDASFVWQGLYQAIARCNGAIANINTTSSPSSNDQVTFNDVAGHAYFVRAWSYFELANLFGDVPLWLELPSSGNTNKALSTKSEVFQQIISDATNAASLLNGNAGVGYPKANAANMLLAKVYMTIATNNDLQTSGGSSEYWNLANQAAQSVYGQYSLVNDYGSLFTVQGENSAESIFELQISQDATNSQMGRNFTPWKYKAGMHFGWFRVSAFQHDKHLKAYGGNTNWNANNLSTYPDSRYKATYLSEYQRSDRTPPAGLMRVYPHNPSRGRFAIAHPYLFKWTEKDKAHNNQFNSQNVVVYRYAELLLMLAEISNELGNGQQMTYLQPILDRAGVTARTQFSQGQSAFRDAIMDEYKFELIGEGHDSWHVRRRGVQYFVNKILNPHNNSIGQKVAVGAKKYAANLEVKFSTDPNEIMKMPIPLSEINTNELIN